MEQCWEWAQSSEFTYRICECYESSTADILKVIQPSRCPPRPDGTIFVRPLIVMEARLLVHVDAVDDSISLSEAEQNEHFRGVKHKAPCSLCTAQCYLLEFCSKVVSVS